MHKSIPEHDRPVDVWGIGTIMMFIINSEYMSALTKDLYSLPQQVIDDLIKEVSSRSRMTVSLVARSFVWACVQVDQGARITAQQAEGHQWFSEDRHKGRMKILRRSIELSWNAKRNVFPGTDRLGDLGAVARTAERQPTASLPSTTAGSMMASHYFATINFNKSGHMPTPPRPDQAASENVPAIRVQNSSSVEVPETPPEDRGAEHPPRLKGPKRCPSSSLSNMRGLFAGGISRHLELPVACKKRKVSGM